MIKFLLVLLLITSTTPALAGVELKYKWGKPGQLFSLKIENARLKIKLSNEQGNRFIFFDSKKGQTTIYNIEKKELETSKQTPSAPSFFPSSKKISDKAKKGNWLASHYRFKREKDSIDYWLVGFQDIHINQEDFKKTRNFLEHLPVRLGKPERLILESLLTGKGLIVEVETGDEVLKLDALRKRKFGKNELLLPTSSHQQNPDK